MSSPTTDCTTCGKPGYIGALDSTILCKDCFREAVGDKMADKVDKMVQKIAKRHRPT